MTTSQQNRQSPHSDRTTHDIRVVARAQFLPDQSDPDASRYVYVYRIEIENLGSAPARLRARHWRIVDAQGRSEEVVGPGVVGEQPLIEPGERYEYRSSCPLTTSWGTMEGHYVFEDAAGESFDVEIGRFFLVPSAPALAT